VKAGAEYDLDDVVLSADVLDLIEDVVVDEVEGVLVRRQQDYACSVPVVSSVQVKLDSVLSELVDKRAVPDPCLSASQSFSELLVGGTTILRNSDFLVSKIFRLLNSF